jgi:hypothetical protein
MKQLKDITLKNVPENVKAMAGICGNLFDKLEMFVFPDFCRFFKNPLHILKSRDIDRSR